MASCRRVTSGTLVLHYVLPFVYISASGSRHASDMRPSKLVLASSLVSAAPVVSSVGSYDRVTKGHGTILITPELEGPSTLSGVPTPDLRDYIYL